MLKFVQQKFNLLELEGLAFLVFAEQTSSKKHVSFKKALSFPYKLRQHCKVLTYDINIIISMDTISQLIEVLTLQ